MSKRYDAVTKRLLEQRPQDWVDFLQLPPGPLTLLDTDLSTVSAAADLILRVDASSPYLMHNELETGKDTARIPEELHHYSSLIEKKFRLPVVSTVFLLHPASHSSTITGHLERHWPDGQVYRLFLYKVVRVWQVKPERFLEGGIGLLPFTPIAAVTQGEVPGIIAAMEARMAVAGVDDAEAAELWVATNVLMGLQYRYNAVFKEQVLRRVRRMRESITYQEILNEGREEGRVEGALNEARRLVVRAGTHRLGPVTERAEAQISGITSLSELEGLLDRVFDVETWEDLLR